MTRDIYQSLALLSLSSCPYTAKAVVFFGPGGSMLRPLRRGIGGPEGFPAREIFRPGVACGGFNVSVGRGVRRSGEISAGEISPLASRPCRP